LPKPWSREQYSLASNLLPENQKGKAQNSAKRYDSPGDTTNEEQQMLEEKIINQESSSADPVVTLTVNGRVNNITVKPNWPLRDVLREKLGLISIKDFCNGYGACGSCTVIMNGRPVLSCMILAAQCDGAVIETAEGIADSNHPLIEAYIMNWTAQCGYCTPGFLVTAKALLDHNPNPTVDEIKEALAGNLCRCGTYPMHVKAILEAAKKLREKTR
jgi:aerobic-type carbon monoxide dehydrogenase small subunit (CoxS/CutS family)